MIADQDTVDIEKDGQRITLNHFAVPEGQSEDLMEASRAQSLQALEMVNCKLVESKFGYVVDAVVSVEGAQAANVFKNAAKTKSTTTGFTEDMQQLQGRLLNPAQLLKQKLC